MNPEQPESFEDIQDRALGRPPRLRRQLRHALARVDRGKALRTALVLTVVAAFAIFRALDEHIFDLPDAWLVAGVAALFGIFLLVAVVMQIASPESGGETDA